ncbi:MAG: hypothetical protein IPF50_12295, partial [Proteobacteria bacterium]|nr:hypothetical protein [Pseudomonadota bacterium]
DVLRLSTAIVNLYINAPDTMEAGRVQTYAAEAGEATLNLEVRDSRTNALLGRVVDRRETRSQVALQPASPRHQPCGLPLAVLAVDIDRPARVSTNSRRSTVPDTLTRAEAQVNSRPYGTPGSITA